MSNSGFLGASLILVHSLLSWALPLGVDFLLVNTLLLFIVSKTLSGFCLFVFLWLCWVLVAVMGVLSLQWVGATLQVRGMSFSLWRLPLLWSTGCRACGFSSCSSWALESRLSNCGAQGQWIQLPYSMWNFPRPGIEPMSPVLAGRFLTTGPPGKSFKSFISHETQYSWKGIRQLLESCFTKEESEDQRDHLMPMVTWVGNSRGPDSWFIVSSIRTRERRK